MAHWSVFSVWLRAKSNCRNDEGANLLEYLFLVILIALVAMLAIIALGGGITHKYSSANNGFNTPH